MEFRLPLAAWVAIGALPLFVNNWGFSGHPLILPWEAGYASAAAKALPSGSESRWNTVTGHYTPPNGDLLSGLYGAFFALAAILVVLAYAVPVLMLFSLAWLAVVDFRFATSCWEGYHFWIPVVEHVWYIQYTIFPL